MRVGFVGDIHGMAHQLRRLLARIPDDVERVVFLGDYVNRGSLSADVLETLVRLGEEQPDRYAFLEGHHDTGLRDAVEQGNVASFLAMGGAATIRSYVGHIREDVHTELLRAIPESHIAFLRRLQPVLEGADWIAAHERLVDRRGKFGVFGHSPQTSLVPRVGASEALIDTGCGTFPGAPLTCYLLPEGTWVQAPA